MVFFLKSTRKDVRIPRADHLNLPTYFENQGVHIENTYNLL